MPRKFTFKKFSFMVITLLIPCIFIELFLRVFFAFQVGPDVLLYGTPFSHHQQTYDPQGAWDRKAKEMHTVNFHENVVADYSKYYPHQSRVDFDENDKTFSVTINGQGFRGREIEKEKKPGVIRIVTLGASSTFGFHDRDNETYPYYLEEKLNEMSKTDSCIAGKVFEVINLGMPHLTAENIYSLFLNEALPLEPDIVTFYEGINDAAKTPKEPTLIENTKQSVKGLPLANEIFRQLRYRLITFAMIGGIISKEITEFTAQDFKNHLVGRSEEFLSYLSKMNGVCREKNIRFIVATQQASPVTVDRQKVKGITYAQEVASVREKLDKTGKLTPEQMYFLTHSHIMDGLRKWVADSNIAFVDVQKALDQDRDCLVNWVHLNPRGNRIVAGALAGGISGLLCSNGNKGALAHP